MARGGRRKAGWTWWRTRSRSGSAQAISGEAARLATTDTFYDALGVNDSAVKVLDAPTLKKIAQELVAAVRRSVTIDWTVRESARAGIRVIVRRVLRKYGYPPDKQEKATLLVLEQAETLCRDWAA